MNITCFQPRLREFPIPVHPRTHVLIVHSARRWVVSKINGRIHVALFWLALVLIGGCFALVGAAYAYAF
jgi:hypothetical protein